MVHRALWESQPLTWNSHPLIPHQWWKNRSVDSVVRPMCSACAQWYSLMFHRWVLALNPGVGAEPCLKWSTAPYNQHPPRWQGLYHPLFLMSCQWTQLEWLNPFLHPYHIDMLHLTYLSCLLATYSKWSSPALIISTAIGMKWWRILSKGLSVTRKPTSRWTMSWTGKDQVICCCVLDQDHTELILSVWITTVVKCDKLCSCRYHRIIDC